jgi:hypothetical protein
VLVAPGKSLLPAAREDAQPTLKRLRRFRHCNKATTLAGRVTRLVDASGATAALTALAGFTETREQLPTRQRGTMSFLLSDRCELTENQLGLIFAPRR